jgi:hypothetical protein
VVRGCEGQGVGAARQQRQLACVLGRGRRSRPLRGRRRQAAACVALACGSWTSAPDFRPDPQPRAAPPRAAPQEEQLGAGSFAGIRSLDLSGLRIRDTGSAFASGCAAARAPGRDGGPADGAAAAAGPQAAAIGAAAAGAKAGGDAAPAAPASLAPRGTPFGALLELVLDDNLLTSSALPALAGLSSLTALRLNGNRLGEAAAPVAPGAAAEGAAKADAAPAAPAPQAAGAAAVIAVPTVAVACATAPAAGAATSRSANSCGVAGDCSAPQQPAASCAIRAPGPANPAASAAPAAACGPGPAPGPAAAALAALQILQLRGNGLTSLAPLQLGARAPCLRTLDVSGNELARLEGLEGLGRLRELDVSRNKLRWDGGPPACGPWSGRAGAGEVEGWFPRVCAALATQAPSGSLAPRLCGPRLAPQPRWRAGRAARTARSGATAQLRHAHPRRRRRNPHQVARR